VFLSEGRQANSVNSHSMFGKQGMRKSRVRSKGEDVPYPEGKSEALADLLGSSEGGRPFVTEGH
jgi:hypothetical protein